MSASEEKDESEVMPDSIGTVNHFPFAKKVMSIQKAMNGKKIIINGSTKLTVEAWEYDRKIRVHEQLKLARKLRSKMEDALEKARKASDANEAKKIFYEHRNEMLQLASLTDAVLGGYTCDNYDQYISAEIIEEENQNKSFESSQKYLNALKQRMFWEVSPSQFFKDNHELLKEVAIPDNHEVPMNENTSRMSDSDTQQQSLVQPTKKLSKSISETKAISVENTSLLSSPNNKKISPQKNSKSKFESPSKSHDELKPKKGDEKDDNFVSNRKESPQVQNVKKSSPTIKCSSIIIKHRLAIPKPAINSAPSKVTTKQNTTERKERKNDFLHDEDLRKIPAKKVKVKPTIKPNKVGKKCHNCKEIKIESYICHYWFITGNKCKKSFCKDCTEMYGVTGSHTEDWHCPSCLKLCKCAVCEKEREREALRNTKKRRLRH